MPSPIDLTGRRFGKLKVLGLSPVKKNAKRYYLCLCGCGKKDIKRGADLTRGSIKSCGCLLKESAQARFSTHGFTKSGDDVKKSFYSRYNDIKKRCSDPKTMGWKNYGGRGIKNLWSTFPQFKLDMWKPFLNHVKRYGKDKTFIDRIDNNGNYCKENCRWVTRSENNNNTRRNCLVLFRRKIQNISQWSKELGLKENLIRDRLRWGWSARKAFLTPIRPQKKDKNSNIIY
jgi:hypothetical protein